MRNINSIAKRNTVEDPDSLMMVDPDEGVSGDYYGAGTGPSERQQLFAILGIFRKHWLMIIGITLLGTAAVIVYEAQKPDYYTAGARIQVNNEMNAAGGGNSSASIVLNPGNDAAYFATQLQVLEGPGLLRRVVKTVDLENNPTFLRPAKGQEAGVWQNVLKMFGFARPVPAKASATNEVPSTDRLTLKADTTTDLDKQAESLAPYVSFLQSNLEVNPVRDSRTATKETRLIEVEFTHFDPAIATKVVNAIADTYVLQNLEQKVESNTSAGDFLRKRVAELQSEIRSGEERLINYARSNQILSLDAGQNTVVQRLTDLNGRLSTAENDRIVAEAAYRAAAQNQSNGSTVATTDPRTAGLETQLTALRQQLEQLKVEYTDEWPEVKKVQRQIAAIEKELSVSKKRSTDTQMATLERTYREAASRENELRRNFQQQRAAVLSQNEAAINYRIIQQEIDTNKTLLDNLLQRSRETEVILNGTPNNVRVLDRALVPNSPKGPQRTKNVGIAVFASLFAGIAIAFALHWLDDTIRESDDFESRLGLPVLGLIPSADTGFARRMIPSKLTGRFRRNKGNQDYQIEQYRRPLMVESFNQLRTSLLLSTAGGAPQSVLVTSGQPFEGKTVNAFCLASSLAQLGNRVLLIDADLRCPKIHLIAGIRNNRGLSTLLTTRSLKDEAVQETICANIEPNLDILPSGPSVPNPANLLGSVEMSDLLGLLRAAYTHIVIDSPPVLYFADSVILATNVEAVVLVGRTNYSSRDILARAKKKVQDVCGNIVGIVLNDVPLSNFKYHNNNYYRLLEESEAEESSKTVLHLDS
jgi:capsular exopolysaccharide synthesis family protein